MEYKIKTEELEQWVENNVELLAGMKTTSRLDGNYTIIKLEEWK